MGASKTLQCYITSKQAAREAVWVAARTPECSVTDVEYLPRFGYLIVFGLESDDLEAAEKRLRLYFENNSMLDGKVNWA